jgi:hypothetical protein
MGFENGRLMETGSELSTLVNFDIKFIETSISAVSGAFYINGTIVLIAISWMRPKFICFIPKPLIISSDGCANLYCVGAFSGPA